MRRRAFAPVRADLRGRVCLVTGATSGVGRETACRLAGLGARVVLAGRGPERLDSVRAAIVASGASGVPEVAVVDLADQRSTRAFAAEVAARHPRLDVLVNNAGTWSARRRVSAEGIELTWATNVLACHLVLALLLPALRRARGARVVNVASSLARGLDLDDVQFVRRRYHGLAAYAQSKQADRLLSRAWARRLEPEAVRVNAVTPGATRTPLFGKGGGLQGLLAGLYGRCFGRSVEEGADSLVWLAASPEAAGRYGEFFHDRAVRPCVFRDVAVEDALFALCEQMTGCPAGAVLGKASRSSFR